MGKIILLDELTANKIAAGEVIERPASVVKELVENSIDAGSTQIHIDVMNGGMNKIKVTDNGIGMDEEDAVTAFLRHATSKLKDAEDLFNINTLGFRGEALPSIASVAKVVLITKEDKSLEGTKVEICGGKIINTNPIGTMVGTSIDITELFYNTPARKKYLKTETTEFGHISDIVTRLAMGNPHISFVLNHNGRQVFRTPGTNKLVDVISTIYGIELAKKLVPIISENELLSISGLIGKPEVNRANRQQQTFFINGRYVKSKIISYALEEGFHTLITTGRYPFALINLSINPELVDVNVHPTKMEVRFSKEKEIIKFISLWVQEVLGRQKLIPGYNENNSSETSLINKTLNKAENVKALPKYSQDEIFTRNLFKREEIQLPSSSNENKLSDNTITKEFKAEKNVNNNTTNKVITSKTDNTDKTEEINNLEKSTVNEFKKNNDLKYSVIENINDEKKSTDAKDALEIRETISDNSNVSIDKTIDDKLDLPVRKSSDYEFTSSNVHLPEEINEKAVTYTSKDTTDNNRNKLPYIRPIAQIDKTYIIAQGINGMFIIDQHAAHERVLYEKLLFKDETKETVVQSLLIPLTLELTPSETQVLINNIIIFNELGFVIEHFGGNTFLIRAIPQELSSSGDESFFRDLLDYCLEDISISKDKLREKIIITMACKGAIKANQVLSVHEMEELINQLEKTKTPFTCPHGRPTIIHFSQYELEKKFKRVQ